MVHESARSARRSGWLGAALASLVDVFGVNHSVDEMVTRIETDADALASDWAAVGNDLRKAIVRHAQSGA